MSELLFERFVEGSWSDPSQKEASADATGRVLLNLGNISETVVVDGGTETVQLFKPLVNVFSGPGFRFLTEAQKIDAGLGVHVAATLDLPFGRSSTAIDVWADDGSLSDELLKLVEIALDGGSPGTAADINLRLGEVAFGEDGHIDVVVDGKWTSDILRLEGAVAEAVFEAADIPGKPDPADIVASFDDVSVPDDFGTSGNVPQDYLGLTWTNWGALNTTSQADAFGYYNAATSGDNVGFNGGADPATITGDDFALVEGKFTAGNVFTTDTETYTVRATAFDDGVEIGIQEFEVSSAGPQLVEFDQSVFGNIDEVVFESVDQRVFAVDDLIFDF